MSSSCNATNWGAVFCGHGTCVNDACICDEGWDYDRAFYKINNCYLPANAMLIVHIIVGVTSLVVGLYGVFLVRKLKKDVRFFATLTTASMLSNAAYMLAHHLEGNTHGFASIILVVTTIACISNAFAIALHALLKTVWQFAGGNVRALKHTFIAVQAGELVAFLVCAIVMLVAVAQKDDEMFTNAIAAWVFILSTHFVIVLYCIFVPTNEVVAGLTTASSNLENNNNESFANEESRRVVRKIRRFIHYSKLLGPGIVVTSYIFAILLFAMKSVPFVWIVHFIIILQIPALGMLQFHLARPRSKTLPGNKVSSSATNAGAGLVQDKSSAFIVSGGNHHVGFEQAKSTIGSGEQVVSFNGPTI